MRRALSIFLVLFFGLGPLAATLPAEDDSGLPACCRRHGTHHCAMSTRMAAAVARAANGDKPILTSPATCPYFPGYTVAPNTPPVALAASQIGLPDLLVRPHTPSATRAAACLRQAGIRAVRGPPDCSVA
jgi:hypothetical protein